MSALSREQQVKIIASLVECVSIRSTARLLEVSKNTVNRLELIVGEGCAALLDQRIRDLHTSTIEIDEQHSWVHTRQIHLQEGSPAEWGEQWLYVAIDAVSRLKISYVVGKRTVETAKLFAMDLRDRVIGAPTIYSDGHHPYIEAIEYAFGSRVNYSQLVKQYGSDANEPDASPKASRRVHYQGAVRTKIFGNPQTEKTSTSYVERFNLTTRTTDKRFARRTNGHSKKLEFHCASVALHAAYYNFCRIHSTLRVTPAMAAGISEHVWTIEELIETALQMRAPRPPAPMPPAAPIGGSTSGTTLMGALRAAPMNDTPTSPEDEPQTSRTAVISLGGTSTEKPARPALRLIRGGKT